MNIVSIISVSLLFVFCAILIYWLWSNVLRSKEALTQSKRITFEYITELEIIGCYNVYYTQIEDSYLLIEGDNKGIQSLNSNYSNGKLILSLTKKRKKPNIRVSVFSPCLFGIKVSGGGAIMIKGELVSSTKVSIIINSGGKAFINNLVCKDFVVNIVGSATSTIKRIDCDTFCYHSVGGAFIELNEIKIKQNADFISTGSGGIVLGKLYTAGSIRIKKTGSGTIIVADGECNDLNIDVCGSAKVIGVIKYNTIQASPRAQYLINKKILSKPHS